MIEILIILNVGIFVGMLLAMKAASRNE